MRDMKLHFMGIDSLYLTLVGRDLSGGYHVYHNELPEDSIRGGVMTHGSVLKVTANGTTTSPILRGVWVLDHLLAKPAPPPPPATARCRAPAPTTTSAAAMATGRSRRSTATTSRSST